MFKPKETSEIESIETPVSVTETETASVNLPESVRVEKVYVKGQGKHISFFSLNSQNQVLCIKAKGSHESIRVGSMVPVSDLVRWELANADQLKRYHGKSTANRDMSILA